MKLCPLCEAALTSSLVCAACNAFLDADEGSGPFEALGLSPCWEVDPADLKRRLLSLSRLVHPDYFASADADSREAAERASAELNAAYETLSDDLRRAEWLLGHLGGPASSDQREMPQPFLMQVMEWNELLEVLREAGPESPAWSQLEELSTSLASERAELMEAVGAALTPLPAAGGQELADLRRQLNAVRYVDRARAELDNLRLDAALGGRG